MRTGILSGIVLSVALVAQAAHANLIVNPSNELPLVAGEISGWMEIVGTGWTQRSANPTAQDGSQYFFAGVGASARLRQDVDVSGFATAIDLGLQQFDFSGYVRTFAQVPSDTSRIVVRFLDAGLVDLGGFDSGNIVNANAWQLVSFSGLAPDLTRTIRVDLISTRNNGTNNDGYFDALSLEAVASPVAAPASAWLLIPALAWLVRGRRNVRNPIA